VVLEACGLRTYGSGGAGTRKTRLSKKPEKTQDTANNLEYPPLQA
jgi:hypothetical protein